MIKNPKFDLKYQYHRTLEMSLVLSLLGIIALLMIFKKFDVDISMRALEAPAIEVEDIPITRTIKKVEVPRKPTIPVEDPDVDIEDDIYIPEIDIFDPTLAPPPPPPSIGEELVPFYKVEVKPLLTGGNQAIADYIRRHNLYPPMAYEAGISGRVMISFIAGKDGKTRDVKIIDERPANLGFGDAGVKVMKAMTFTPGMQRDKPVDVLMQQPIKFTIE